MINTNGVNIWSGVIVDINDPKKANRVKVRIFGLHDVPKTDLSNDDLPWTVVSMPPTGSSVTGIGTNHNLKNGSVVIVMFLDGTEMQVPIVMGSISGIQSKDFKKIYQDTNEEYPIKDRMSEPDVNRIARNEKIDETIIQTKRDTIDEDVEFGLKQDLSGLGSTDFHSFSFNNSPDVDRKWTEPETDHASVYPNNRVIETISGHVVEIDDTPGAERIHVYHTTGTSVELQNNGDMITRVEGNEFKINRSNMSVHIIGNTDVTIDGDTSAYLKGNADVQINGDVTANFVGNTDLKIDGDVTAYCVKNVSAQIDGNLDAYVKGNMSAQIDGNVDRRIKGNVNETIDGDYNRTVGGGLAYNVSGSSDYISGAPTTIQGSVVNIN